MAGYRIDKISEETKKEVDRIIRESLNDPRIRGTYAVTWADVTRDLRHGKVYISILEEEYAAPMLKALKSAAGFIRSELGKSLQLRYTPELTFVHDKNIEYGIHIANVLKQVMPKQDAEAGSDEENL